MKTCMLALFGILLMTTFSFAQDYKHPYGLVSKEGKVTDSTGQHIGWVTNDGNIKDATGTKIAHVGADGKVVDAKTGKTIGHAPKNGTFIYHFNETTADTLTTSYPANGTCEVKNSKGEIVVVVHENYKQTGACAYHCLAMHKKGKHMKMK